MAGIYSREEENKTNLHAVNFLYFYWKSKNLPKSIHSANWPLHVLIQNRNTFMTISVLYKIVIKHKRSFQCKTFQCRSADKRIEIIKVSINQNLKKVMNTISHNYIMANYSNTLSLILVNTMLGQIYSPKNWRRTENNKSKDSTNPKNESNKPKESK